jgi:hypothetical protein
MGLANAQRALDYIRIITEFISQPEWVDVVPVFSIVNEALLTTIGRDQIITLYVFVSLHALACANSQSVGSYLLAHDMIRNITGYGEGHGPYIAIHDGFEGTAAWTDFLQGSDRVILDTHVYFAFDNQYTWPPIATGTGLSAGGVWPQQACNAWGVAMNTRCVCVFSHPLPFSFSFADFSFLWCSQTAFGVTLAGEFSNGFNDCGLYLTGVGNTVSYGTECALFLDASQWNATMKAGLMEFALASMDALQNWFFWTWKVCFRLCLCACSLTSMGDT